MHLRSMRWFEVAYLFLFGVIAHAHERSAWTWSCKNRKCEKKELSGNYTAQSMAVCKLLCDPYLNIWPRPTKIMSVNRTILPISPHNIYVKYIGKNELQSTLQNTVLEAWELFKRQLKREAIEEKSMAELSSIHSLYVELDITEDHSSYRFTTNTDESYQLIIVTNLSQVKATIRAQTFFGVRHGLETLSQLVIFDDESGHLVLPVGVSLTDAPTYPYRGIMLDTASNYFSVNSIKRTLDAMAANKLNTFHWHLIGSQSFPFQSKQHPNFTDYGAYSPRKVYTHEDVRSVVKYGRARGVRVLPELDLPANAGEGWQWFPYALSCFKKTPRILYCGHPPCGQLNPTNYHVYELLETLYSEILELFESDIFHMGGYEINFNCWNGSQTITRWMKKNRYQHSDVDFIKLWEMFLRRSYSRLTSANKRRTIPVVLWSNLVNANERTQSNLKKENYIIQISRKSDDSIISSLINRGFRVIFSNYDALYFDCGFAAWMGSGHNWCSPYISWQKVYDNNPETLVNQQGILTYDPEVQKLIWGAEAILFTTQVDETALDSRLWPRASALAERLWSCPIEGWRQAESRILEQRERLVRRGIDAEPLEPEWCIQNQGYCDM